MPTDLTREGLAARGTCVYPACMGHTIPGCQGPCKLGIDPMPRQDLTLPPPIGYISRADLDALIREAKARGMERAAEIYADGENWDYFGAAYDAIRAEAAAIRGEGK